MDRDPVVKYITSKPKVMFTSR